MSDLLYYWTPLGRGWQLSKDQAKTEYRSMLKDLWREAHFALEGGDTDTARNLLNVYNDRRKQGPGDGRKRPLTFDDLRSLPLTGGERKERQGIKEEAIEAANEGDADSARELLDQLNEGRRRRVRYADLLESAN